MTRNTFGAMAVAVWAVVAAFLAFPASAHAAPVGETSDALSGYAGDRNPSTLRADMVAGADVAGAPTYKMVQLAQAICGGLSQGMSENSAIAIGVNAGFEQSTARYLVDVSEWHYCPEKY